MIKVYYNKQLSYIISTIVLLTGLVCLPYVLPFVLAQTVRIPGPGGSSGAASPCGAYAHCQSLTLPGSGVSAETNFVVAVKLTGKTYLKDVGNGGYINNPVTQTGGWGGTVPADLVLTSDAGCTTKLTGWEFTSWDNVAGDATFYMNVGTAANNLVVYMCEGLVSQTTWQGDVAATWDSNYRAVWHIGNGSALDTGALTDSTTNAYVLSIEGSPTASAGIVAGAMSGTIPGPNDLVNSSLTACATNNTIEIWFKGNTSCGYCMIYGAGVATVTELRLKIATTDVEFLYDNTTIATTSGTNYADGTWHYAVTIFNGTNATAYMDGSSVATTAATAPAFTNFKLGGRTLTSGFQYEGAVAEGRISCTDRSANYVTMVNANISNVTTWVTPAIIN